MNRTTGEVIACFYRIPSILDTVHLLLK